MTAHIISSDSEANSIAEELRQFLVAGASERDQKPEPPAAELDRLSASGILAITVPREFGGADVSFETITNVFQRLSAGDPAVTQMTQSHFLFLDAIRQDGTQEQKAFFFGQVLAGARLGNAQAEKGSASALDLQTKLTQGDSGNYRLNGTKYYCTGAILADWLPVAAFDPEERLVLALVPRKEHGVIVSSDWNAMGQRVTFSGTTTFENVAVPENHVIPHWRLFDRPSVFHAYASQLHTAIDIGIAQNALSDAVALVRARGRPRLGAPVSKATEDPHVILRFGQLSAKFHAAEQLLLRAARLLDRATADLTIELAGEAAVAVAEAKAFSEDVVIEITNEIFALSGASATDNALNLSRHWRNARTHTVHDANQWRYHSAGNYLLNGVLPGKPIRKKAAAF
ncbi:SfnB family sulfur acquisition oxidoreductase [Acidocella sp.]|jgi:SfnB family sulfur acquisition oxidoreductase|uniref:SfnB family sulfur acquisition oxidoreductase n=1 Tax=Acidocella sp. TaxID=50710 RepID=UPI002F4209D2